MASIRSVRPMLAVVLEHRDALEHRDPDSERSTAWITDGPSAPVLAQPSTGILGLEQRLAAPESGRVEPFRFAARDGRNRIVEQHESDRRAGRRRIIAGSMNCHTEIPAARSTTSSEERLSIRKMPIVPIRTAKGRTSSEKDGKRSSVIQASSETWNIAGIVAGTTEHLDEVDEENQHATEQEHRQHGDERSAAKNTAQASTLH